MSEAYIKRRNKLRFNMVVLSLFCFIAVLLAIIYGSSYLAFYYVTGSQVLAFASFGGALTVAVLIMALWLRITLKLRAQLKTLENSIPASGVTV